MQCPLLLHCPVSELSHCFKIFNIENNALINILLNVILYIGLFLGSYTEM